MYDKKAVAKYTLSDKGKLARKRVEKKRYRGRLLARYGLTGEQYDALLIQQGNVCAACLRPETRPVRKDGSIRLLSVDHCHHSGKVRGLLCYGCNSALGFLDDDPEYVAKLLQYITNHTSCTS